MEKASYYILVASMLVLLIIGDVSCILKPTRNRLRAICHGTRYRCRKLSFCNNCTEANVPLKHVHYKFDNLFIRNLNGIFSCYEEVSYVDITFIYNSMIMFTIYSVIFQSDALYKA